MGKQYDVYVQKGTPLWKVVTNVLFSHVGLFVLVIGYCVAGNSNSYYSSDICIFVDLFCFFFEGALVFMELEKQRELDEKAAKEQKTEVLN